MNGLDVTLAALALYGATFATAGLLFGLVLEARRRDRRAAAIIAAQMETVAATRARLAQSEKLAALGQLAAAIAHEVRNALAVIRSAAQGLNESLPDADRRHAARVLVHHRGDRSPGQRRVVAAQLRAPTAARAARRSRSERSSTRRCCWRVPSSRRRRSTSSVRRARCCRRCRPDSDLIVQVLLGLLSNAADAVPRGGEVRLDARAGEGVVEIGVADSGPGVPEALRGRVFEPFFTTRDKGTGLGLAVARQIVEAHAGHIDVGERPGGGALFRISLPAAATGTAAGSWA